MVNSIGGSPLGLQQSLNSASQSQSSARERIATGKQVNSAADNAAGLAIINRLRGESEGFSQSIRNAVDAVSLLQVAGDTLSTVTNDVQRIRELSLQSANGTLNDSDRATLQAEVSQLQEGIASRLEDAEFNGRALFSSDESISIAVGSEASDNIELESSDLSTDIDDLLTIDISTQQGATDALQLADDFLQTINERGAELGAVSNRLDSAISTLQNSRISSEQSRSRLEDADIAKEVSNLAEANIKKDVGLALRAQANSDAKLVLRLLGE